MTGQLARPRTVSEMVQMARAFLARKGCEEARLEAELLVAHALSTDRLGLFMGLERPLEDSEIDAARDLLVRRGRREPVAYITGEREFYGRPFRVTRDVLIPRPETELLVDRAREWVRERGAEPGAEPAPDSGPGPGTETLRILDWGTGSGCIAVTLALELTGSRVLAVDAFEPTLVVARRNAERLGAEIELRLASSLDGLQGPFDLLVSNPPYVEPAEREGLAPEVRDYEPEPALFAPAGDPDHWVRRILDALPRLVSPAGRCLVELGAGQAPRALELARERGLRARALSDLSGIERVLDVG